jgi:hypothetical protein
MNYSSLSSSTTLNSGDDSFQWQLTVSSSLSLPYLYDHSSNTSVCTSNSGGLLGWSSNSSGSIEYMNTSTYRSSMMGSYETYLYKYNPQGACAGIVSELYVPFRQRMLDGQLLAPMRRRYAVQQAVETELRGVLSSLPGWLGGECRWQLRRYLCGSQLLGAHHWSLKSALDDDAQQQQQQSGGSTLNASSLLKVWVSKYNVSTSKGSSLLDRQLYAPSYPHRSVCESYWSSCGSFLDRLKSMESHRSLYNKLTLWSSSSCDATADVPSYSGAGASAASDGTDDDEKPQLITVSRFPSSNQTVLNLRLAGYDSSGILTVSSSLNKLQSSSEYVLYEDISYRPECPQGFVVPDDPGHPRNKWISGTGCAEACRYVIVS